MAAGYEVHIFYLWLPAPELAVARVRSRVEAGGHAVSEQVVRRRFWRSLVNFDRLYRSISTTWRLYDGSVVQGRRLIAHGAGSAELQILETETWREIQRRIEDFK